MVKAISIALIALLITLTGCAICATWEWHLTNQSTRASLNAAPAIVQEAGQTLAAINQPCGLSKPCGTIATLNKAITKVGDAVVTTQLEERSTLPHVTAAMDTLNQAGSKLGNTANALTDELGALHKTTDAATGLTVALTGDAGAVKDMIEDAQPLLEAYTKTGTDLDGILKDNATQFHESLVHLDSMSASGDKMLVDAQWKTHQLLHPDKVKLSFWTGSEATLLWLHTYVIPPVVLF